MRMRKSWLPKSRKQYLRSALPPILAHTGLVKKIVSAAAATQAWGRMAHEIEQQKPEVLVFNGGMMERGTYVLPVPGN